MPLWAADSGSRRLEFDLAARHSDYSTSGGIESWKSGLNFQLTEWLRLRATLSRDVREPTFAERFDVQGGGGSINEQAIGGIPTPFGVTQPGSSGTVFQITSTNLGNPDLKPEEADTVTAGIIVQPQDTGLQFTVDWYDIDLSDAIGQLGVQGIVNECNASSGTSPLCQYVFRDPVTGAVTAVRNPFLNINNARIRGIDYEALWNKETDVFGNRPETLTLRFLAGRLLEDSTTTPTGTVTDFAGELGEPGFRALVSARWQIGGFGVMLQERYLGESGINPTNAQSSGTITFIQFEPGRIPAGPTQFTVDDATVEAKAYTDLTFSYDRDISNGKTWQVALAITNLLDENPPIIPVFDQRFSSQSNPQGFNTYDVYGRRYLLSFNYRL
jgi:iron complex outermembrane recepter protein